LATLSLRGLNSLAPLVGAAYPKFTCAVQLRVGWKIDADRTWICSQWFRPRAHIVCVPAYVPSRESSLHDDLLRGEVAERHVYVDNFAIFPPPGPEIIETIQYDHESRTRRHVVGGTTFTERSTSGEFRGYIGALHMLRPCSASCSTGKRHIDRCFVGRRVA